MTNSKNRKNLTLIIIQIASWCFFVWFDLFTKSLAEVSLKGQQPYVLVNGVLELLYLENTGAAFSMLENAQWLFVIIALAAIAFITWFLWKTPQKAHFAPLHVLLTLISAGAFGNLYDRVRLHYVRDFIYFVLIDFPVFNVADIYVTVSTALLAVYVIFFYKDQDFAFLRNKAES